MPDGFLLGRSEVHSRITSFRSRKAVILSPFTQYPVLNMPFCQTLRKNLLFSEKSFFIVHLVMLSCGSRENFVWWCTCHIQMQTKKDHKNPLYRTFMVSLIYYIFLINPIPDRYPLGTVIIHSSPCTDVQFSCNAPVTRKPWLILY